MNLADELRGLSVRKLVRTGNKRRLFCIDDTNAAQAKRELKLQKRRVAQRAWEIANPERAKAIRDRARAKFRAKDQTATKLRKRNWRLNNIEHVRKYNAKQMRERRRKYPERELEAKRRDYAKHKDARNAARRLRYAARRAAVLAFRLKEAA